jgi:hypothetical protein
MTVAGASAPSRREARSFPWRAAVLVGHVQLLLLSHDSFHRGSRENPITLCQGPP